MRLVEDIHTRQQAERILDKANFMVGSGDRIVQGNVRIYENEVPAWSGRTAYLDVIAGFRYTGKLDESKVNAIKEAISKEGFEYTLYANLPDEKSENGCVYMLFFQKAVRHRC